MKKFKKIGALCAAFLLGVSAMAFGACGGVDADTDANDVKSEKIENAEDWAAAFKIDDHGSYTIQYSMERTYAQENETETMKANVIFKTTGTLAYMKQEYTLVENGESSTQQMEMYIVKEDGAVSMYEYEDGKLTDSVKYTQENNAKAYESVCSSYLTGAEFIEEFLEITYDKVSYGDEDKGYVYEENTQTRGTKVVLKFIDKKIAAFIMTENRTSGAGDTATTSTSTLKGTFFDYGKTEVELPADATGAVEK